MKKARLHLHFLALLALIVSPILLSGADTKSAPKKFEISYTTIDTPEFKSAYKKYTAFKKRFESGEVSKEEFEEIQFGLEAAERRLPNLIRIKSQGGPLSAFFEAAGQGDAFTVINTADPADLETPLPPFELKNSNWGTIIGVLGHLLNPRGLDLRFVGGDNPDPAAAKTVVCVLRRTDAASDAKRTARAELESFQIGDYIFKDQTMEVIVDAIRSAWELEPTNDPAALRIKFHAATKLLLVSGPAPATNIARQVIAGLKKKPVVL